jgi:DNA-binding NarL/FixJ family response regulator
MALKVLIADDHRLMLDGIQRALSGIEDIVVVGETHSGAHVLPLIGRTNPDLVLMDVHMPGMDGLTCLDRIRKRYPDVKVVMMSASTEKDQIHHVLRRGASAYICKTVNPVDIPSALRQACEETVYHAVGLAEPEDSPAATAVGLTERERTILQAVASGMTNKAISREFWVTEQTVKFHLTNIYRKLGVANRSGATRYAHQHGLVDIAF